MWSHSVALTMAPLESFRPPYLHQLTLLTASAKPAASLLDPIEANPNSDPKIGHFGLVTESLPVWGFLVESVSRSTACVLSGDCLSLLVVLGLAGK